MRLKRARVLVLLLVVIAGLLQIPAQADTLQLNVAEDKTTGYNRSAFKHWIDADKDGCDTRAEVLIEEAIVKPKIGSKCKLTGGKWVSAYDGKTITNPSQLDVDHMVPLAEAWRSGAWKWTAAQRQVFANDLDNSEALIAVTLTTNRSKGDKDPSRWLPQNDKCSYLTSWISIKEKYDLNVDNLEIKEILKYKSKCNLNLVSGEEDVPTPPTPTITQEDWQERGQNWVLVKLSSNSSQYPPKNFYQGFSISSDKNIASVVNDQTAIECFKGNSALQNDRHKEINLVGGIFLSPNGKNTELFISDIKQVISCILNPSYTFKISYKYYEVGGLGPNLIQKSSTEFIIDATRPFPTLTPSPTSTPAVLVTPGAFCEPAGAIGQSSSGVTYTCKASSSDTRNRWRQ